MFLWIFLSALSVTALLVCGCPESAPVVRVCSANSQSSMTDSAVVLDSTALPNDGYLRTCSCSLSTTKHDKLERFTVQGNVSTSEFQLAVDEVVVTRSVKSFSYSHHETATITFQQSGLRVPAFCFSFKGVSWGPGAKKKFKIECQSTTTTVKPRAPPTTRVSTAAVKSTTSTTSTTSTAPTTFITSPPTLQETNFTSTPSVVDEITTSSRLTSNVAHTGYTDKAEVATRTSTARVPNETSSITKPSQMLSQNMHCGELNPAVDVCNDGKNSGNTVYLDAGGVPRYLDNVSCACTLSFDALRPSVRFVRVTPTKDASNMSLRVNDNSISMKQNQPTSVPVSENMTIVFMKSTSDVKIQCFGFTTDQGQTSFKIECKTAQGSTSGTTQNSISTPTSTSPANTPTSTSIGSNGSASETTTRPTKESDADKVQKDDDTTNIGTIAGAAAGAVIVIAVVVVVTVIICRRKSARRQKGHEDTPDPGDKDDPYDMTINAGYVSVDACQTQNNKDVQRDPRGYALVNKPKPAPKPAPSSAGGTEYAEYNHLNDILDNRTPDNVYNTAGGAVEDADMGDYNRLNELPHSRTPDNVYNTATAGGTVGDVDMDDYNRLNEIQAHNVTDNLYSVANARGNTDSVYNHATDRT